MTQDGETIPVRRDQSDEVVQTSLELRIRYSDRPRQVLPINRASFDLAFEAGPELRFTFQAGQLRFQCQGSAGRVYKDGQPVRSGKLEVGGVLEVGSHRVLLWDTGAPAAYLKGYSAPYSNEIWPLGPGHHPIGRPGRRDNAVSLDHPTVSRAHATISADPEGVYTLLAESATNPVCWRGQEVEPGATRELHHGDLLEIGELVLRFHQPAGGLAPQHEGAALRVRSLGGLTVELGGTQILDKTWKTQYIKWMFALLAHHWDQPIGIEVLTEALWPDSDARKARNNLKFSLSTLRATLRAHLPEELRGTEVVARSSSSLQLNPDLLEHHDVVELRRLAQAAGSEHDPSWEEAATRVVLAYAGPFLPACYMDWAVTARQTIESQVLSIARALLGRLEQAQQWEAVVPLGNQVLTIDPHAQWACLLAMQALRHTHRASQAIKLFERCRKVWMKELGVEPELDLLREHQLALGLV